MTKTEALKQRKELITLLKQWTGAEIMARLGNINIKRAVDFYQIMLSKEDEIRQLVFGDSNILEIAYEWGMLKRPGRGTVGRKKSD